MNKQNYIVFVGKQITKKKEKKKIETFSPALVYPDLWHTSSHYFKCNNTGDNRMVNIFP